MRAQFTAGEPPVSTSLRSSHLEMTSFSARRTPPVLQTNVDIDFAQRALTMSVTLTTRFGRRPAYDWLLRLDLATCPPVHEQWHGHAYCGSGQIEIEVKPSHWPRQQERWFLHLWMRDPLGSSDWDLVDTRLLNWMG